jgi:DNA topoisomerase-6 subunit B
LGPDKYRYKIIIWVFNAFSYLPSISKKELITMSKKIETVTTAQVSEYFSKNLGQIGLSSPTKAVLTAVKEFVDNSLDSCEEMGVLPEIRVEVEKLGPGIAKGTDKVRVKVLDNAAGLEEKFVPSAFGQFLSSSKFNRGRVTRGRQGLGGTVLVVYAQLTQGRGAQIITKTDKDKKALSCLVEVDIKHNIGVIKEASRIDWDRKHGTSIEIVMDGKVQVNGDAGLLTYLLGTSLVNPHLKLVYQLPEMEEITIERTSNEVPLIPEAVDPHPHTLKLGEFISHGHLFPNLKVKDWLKNTFSKVNESAISTIAQDKELKPLLSKLVSQLGENDHKPLYSFIQNMKLPSPSTSSVMAIGEENLSKSVNNLGKVDFFSVITRPPTICDFKPVQIEVSIARLADSSIESDRLVQVLRFANRVPMQFDKGNDVSIQAIESVNWKAYGLNQSKGSLPTGPFVFCVSIISPFIAFKNASKETIDAEEELLEEVRRTLIQAGQKLAKFVKKEEKEEDLERKRLYIEQFAPILINCLFEISEEPQSRRAKIQKGLSKILGRDTEEAEQELEKHNVKIEKEAQQNG